jgi:aromatic-L-amino-acid decarboxylase
VPEKPWPLEPDDELLRRWTDLTTAFVREHIASLAAQPSADVANADELAAFYRDGLPERGCDLEKLLARLAPAVAKSFNTAGPGYLAFIPGGGIYAAALADFIACAVNRYVGVRQAAPVLVQIEETAIAWLAGLMGYPASARGILTSGGSLSNFAAIVTARSARLGEELARGTLYVSEETHHSVAKAARIAGLPARNLRVVGVDERFCLRPDALEEQLRADHARGLIPFLVIPSVGTTNTGAVDPLPEILELARRYGLWVHADAAYGGFFRMVPDGPALMPGLEECDSITLDPHKGLFLPYGTGCLLVRDADALRRAHQHDAGYLQDVTSEAGSFADLSPELSRDFRGLRLWLPLQLHGAAAFREQLQEKLELARWAYRELAADASFEMLDEPQLSVVAFALRGEDADRHGAELLRRVNGRRRVFLSSTRLRGRYVLRICVLSFRTHADRVRDAVLALREEARALGG